MEVIAALLQGQTASSSGGEAGVDQQGSQQPAASKHHQTSAALDYIVAVDSATKRHHGEVHLRAGRQRRSVSAGTRRNKRETAEPEDEKQFYLSCGTIEAADPSVMHSAPIGLQRRASIRRASLSAMNRIATAAMAAPAGASPTATGAAAKSGRRWRMPVEYILGDDYTTHPALGGGSNGKSGAAKDTKRLPMTVDRLAMSLAHVESKTDWVDADDELDPVYEIVANKVIAKAAQRHNVTIVNTGVLAGPNASSTPDADVLIDEERHNDFFNKLTRYIGQALQPTVESALQSAADDRTKEREMQQFQQQLSYEASGPRPPKDGADGGEKESRSQRAEGQPREGATHVPSLRLRPTSAPAVGRRSRPQSSGGRSTQHYNRFELLVPGSARPLIPHMPQSGRPLLTLSGETGSYDANRANTARQGAEPKRRNSRVQSASRRVRSNSPTKRKLPDPKPPMQMPKNGWSGTMTGMVFNGTNSLLQLPVVPNFDDLVRSFALEWWMKPELTLDMFPVSLFHVDEPARPDMGMVLSVQLVYHSNDGDGAEAATPTGGYDQQGTVFMRVFIRDVSNRSLEALIELRRFFAPETGMNNRHKHFLLMLPSTESGNLSLEVNGTSTGTTQFLQKERANHFEPWRGVINVGGMLDKEDPQQVKHGFKGSMMQMRLWTFDSEEVEDEATAKLQAMTASTRGGGLAASGRSPAKAAAAAVSATGEDQPMYYSPRLLHRFPLAPNTARDQTSPRQPAASSDGPIKVDVNDGHGGLQDEPLAIVDEVRMLQEGTPRAAAAVVDGQGKSCAWSEPELALDVAPVFDGEQLAVNLGQLNYLTDNFQRFSIDISFCCPSCDEGAPGSVGITAKGGLNGKSRFAATHKYSDMMSLIGMSDMQEKKPGFGIILNAEPVKGDAVFKHSPGFITFFVSDCEGRRLASSARVPDRTIHDGNWHTLKWDVMDAETNRMAVALDGIQVDLIQFMRAGPKTFAPCTAWVCLGGHNARNWKVRFPFRGSIRSCSITQQETVIGRWKLDEGPGAMVAIDHSGYGNHGTYVDLQRISGGGSRSTSAGGSRPSVRHSTFWVLTEPEVARAKGGSDDEEEDESPEAAKQRKQMLQRRFRSNKVFLSVFAVHGVENPRTGAVCEAIHDMIEANQPRISDPFMTPHTPRRTRASEDEKQSLMSWTLPPSVQHPIESSGQVVPQLEKAMKRAAALDERHHLIVSLRIGDSRVSMVTLRPQRITPMTATFSEKMLKWVGAFSTYGTANKKMLLLNSMYDGVLRALLEVGCSPAVYQRAAFDPSHFKESLEASGLPWRMPLMVYLLLADVEYGSSLMLVPGLRKLCTQHTAMSFFSFVDRMWDAARPHAARVVQRNVRQYFGKKWFNALNEVRLAKRRRLQCIQSLRQLHPQVLAKTHMQATVIQLTQFTSAGFPAALPPILKATVQSIQTLLLQLGYELTIHEGCTKGELAHIIKSLNRNRNMNLVYIVGVGGITTFDIPRHPLRDQLELAEEEDGARAVLELNYEQWYEKCRTVETEAHAQAKEAEQAAAAAAAAAAAVPTTSAAKGGKGAEPAPAKPKRKKKRIDAQGDVLFGGDAKRKEEEERKLLVEEELTREDWERYALAQHSSLVDTLCTVIAFETRWWNKYGGPRCCVAAKDSSSEWNSTDDMVVVDDLVKPVNPNLFPMPDSAAASSGSFACSPHPSSARGSLPGEQTILVVDALPLAPSSRTQSNKRVSANRGFGLCRGSNAEAFTVQYPACSQLCLSYTFRKALQGCCAKNETFLNMNNNIDFSLGAEYMLNRMRRYLEPAGADFQTTFEGVELPFITDLELTRGLLTTRAARAAKRGEANATKSVVRFQLALDSRAYAVNTFDAAALLRDSVFRDGVTGIATTPNGAPGTLQLVEATATPLFVAHYGAAGRSGAKATSEAVRLVETILGDDLVRATPLLFGQVQVELVNAASVAGLLRGEGGVEHLFEKVEQIVVGRVNVAQSKWPKVDKLFRMNAVSDKYPGMRLVSAVME